MKDPYIVSTFISAYEDSVTREIVVFGLENAVILFNEKADSGNYTCIRLDKAKYSEESGVVDYVGKGGIVAMYCNEKNSLAGWMKTETETSDIPWYVDCGDIEEIE